MTSQHASMQSRPQFLIEAKKIEKEMLFGFDNDEGFGVGASCIVLVGK